MADFVIRVELYAHPTNEVYDRLQEAMEGNGFSRLIGGFSNSTGRRATWYLPPAEYLLRANLTLEQARDLAARVASAVWPTYGILVIHALDIAWDGLRVAEPSVTY
jgi:hypothetical protein